LPGAGAVHHIIRVILHRRLFDHFVGGAGQHWWHGKAEYFRSLEIDDEFELGWLRHRKIFWFCALQNTRNISLWPI
jgi:hypothetical protein